MSQKHQVRCDDQGKIFDEDGEPTGFVTSIVFGKRLAACFNTCDGFPTEELEEETFEDAILAMSYEHVAEMNKLKKQRDQLLAAGRAVVDRWNSPLWKDQPHTAEFIAKLNDAIKQAGG